MSALSYRWGEKGTQRLRNVPKFTKDTLGRVPIQIKVRLLLVRNCYLGGPPGTPSSGIHSLVWFPPMSAQLGPETSFSVMLGQVSGGWVRACALSYWRSSSWSIRRLHPAVTLREGQPAMWRGHMEERPTLSSRAQPAPPCQPCA